MPGLIFTKLVSIKNLNANDLQNSSSIRGTIIPAPNNLNAIKRQTKGPKESSHGLKPIGFPINGYVPSKPIQNKNTMIPPAMEIKSKIKQTSLLTYFQANPKTIIVTMALTGYKNASEIPVKVPK